MTKKSESGQTIIELLVATLVVGLVVISVAVGLTYSIKNTSEVRYRQSASTLGQDAIEFFRQQRAIFGWNSFSAAMSGTRTYCLKTIPTSLVSLPLPSTCSLTDTVPATAGFNPGFRREVQIINTGPGTEIQITATVSWQRTNGQDSEVILRQTLKARN